MEKQWNLGDDCFIADVNIEHGRMRFRVMPARVTHLASRVATATSQNPPPESTFGRWDLESNGHPFPNRRSAFVHVWKEMRNNNISLFTPIRFEGTRPQLRNLPARIPTIGQVVYGCDVERKETFEAEIGYLRYEFGKLHVGYDQSPGNPEASNIRITEWWDTREEAEAHVTWCLGSLFSFVSKEQLAARTDAEINKIWSDAEKFFRSAEGKENARHLGEFLRQA